MSIVIALRIKNGDMVLATDQRGIVGDPSGPDFIDHNQIKYITFRSGAIGMSDCVEFAWKPINEAMALIEKDIESDPLNIIVECLRDHYNKVWPWSKIGEETNNKRPDVQLVYVDIRYGVSRMYILDSATNFAERIMSHYARYLHGRIWNENFNIDQAIALAAFMVHETGEYESKVGKNPTIIKITKQKNEPVIEIMPQSAVDLIIAENAKRLSNFAASFMTGPTC
jgi:hypothetical protein